MKVVSVGLRPRNCDMLQNALPFFFSATCSPILTHPQACHVEIVAAVLLGELNEEHAEVVGVGAFPEKEPQEASVGVALGAFPVKTPQWAWLEVALQAS